MCTLRGKERETKAKTVEARERVGQKVGGHNVVYTQFRHLFSRSWKRSRAVSECAFGRFLQERSGKTLFFAYLVLLRNIY